jgi:hyaluronan synthase
MSVNVLIVMFTLFSVIYTGLNMLTSRVMRHRLKIKRDYDNLPTVTVMLSCFNEGEHAYRTVKSIASSNYPVELMEIIVFDDCSKDDTFEWIAKAQAEHPWIYIEKNAKNVGKAATLARAARKAKNEILISTDGDCILHPDAVRELAVCYVDPHIGGVGGIIGINNANDNLLTQMQTILYNADFNLFKPMENMTRNIQCLGGPLVSYRRELYLSCMPALEGNHFLGEPVTIGEDRLITQEVLKRGFGTYITFRSQAWSGTPITWGNFLKQQMRWRRSACGQWFLSVMNIHKFIKGRGIVTAAASLFPMIANFTLFAFYVFLYQIGTFLPFIVTQIVLWSIIIPIYGLVFNATTGKRDQNPVLQELGIVQTLENPIFASWVMMIWLLVSITLVTPWALCTLDDGGWVTRQDGQNGNA